MMFVIACAVQLFSFGFWMLCALLIRYEWKCHQGF
jgi:hypothetical protein